MGASWVIFFTIINNNNFYFIFYLLNIFRQDHPSGRSIRENSFLDIAQKNFKKRQANPKDIDLCPTESNYITPRAGLNNKGNWMYIVNIPHTRDNYSQLIKSEICR